jgi:hypothetical protein
MRFGDLGRVVLFCLVVTASAFAQPGGAVRDLDGKPIAGAKLVLYSHRTEWGLDNEIVETVQSAADGSYHFTRKLQFDVPSGTTYNNYYIITASHPNYAIGWAVIVASEQQPSYDIVLTKPTQQKFLVQDGEDNPIAGATVWIAFAGDNEDSRPSLRTYLHLPTDIHVASATTDAQGRATLTNLPMTPLSFRTSAEAFADSWENVGKPSDQELQIKLTRAGVVRGTVRNEDGEAVEGAIVAFSANWMNDYTLVRTNPDGQFEASKLVARGGSWTKDGGDGTYKVSIRHPDYCAAVSTLTINPGQTIDNFDISAERGSLLRATIVDPETHDPVGGVRLQAMVGEQRLDGYTNEKGVIEWRTLPGEASISVVSPPGGMYIVGPVRSKKVTVGGDETEVTIEPPSPFRPVVGVRGHVVDADGKAIKSAIVRVMCAEQNVQTAGQHGYGAETSTGNDGAYTIRGYPSSTHMCVYVESRDRAFAGVGEFDVPSVGGDLRQPITLQPTQSADVDLQQASGKEQPNRKMLIYPIVGGQKMWRGSRSAKTNDQSHLKLDGILPGQMYYIEDARRQDSNGLAPAEDSFHLNMQIIPAP